MTRSGLPALALAGIGAGLCLCLSSPAGAIVGGALSRPGETSRHTVMIELPGGRCTGVVIAPRLVLSAAHCFGRIGTYKVRLSGGSVALPLNVALHPDQNPLARKRRDNANDLALLLMEMPLAAEPVRIGPRWTPQQNEKLIAAGFGVTGASGKDRRASPTLREVELEPLDPGLDSSPIQRLFSGDTTMDAPAAGACRGDSGGPIYRRVSGELQLVAVINWSSGDPAKSLPCGAMTGVTSIYPYRGWIEAQARSWGVEPPK